MLAANSELANATLDATNKDTTKEDEAIYGLGDCL